MKMWKTFLPVLRNLIDVEGYTLDQILILMKPVSTENKGPQGPISGRKKYKLQV